MTVSEATGDAVPGFELNTDERDLIRSLIIADPQLVLADDQVIRSLIGEQEGQGRQVVDLRDRLVERLETRLGRLVQANRSMIAAAYENVAGTQQVHRALLGLMDEDDLAGFLRRLTREVPRILDIAELRLCIEADVDETAPAEGLGEGLGERVLAMPEGTVEAYFLLDGQSTAPEIALRATGPEAELVFGPMSPVRSEALMRLDLMGAPAMLACGAEEPDRFSADQGTDLLGFFGGAVQRLLVHHLKPEAGA